MSIFSRRYLLVFVTVFFALSAGGWASSLEDDDNDDDIVIDNPNQVQNFDQQRDELLDAHRLRLVQDGINSDYDTRTSNREWYSCLRKCYGVSGEGFKVTSSLLVALATALDGIALGIGTETDMAKTLILISVITGVVALSLEVLGKHSKKASRQYARDLEALNNQDMGNNVEVADDDDDENV